MSEENGSAVAGNPAGDTAAGQAPANQGAWYGSIEDAGLRGLAETKGWKNPAEALSSYRQLEQHIGVPPERLIKLPEKADAPEWGDIKKKLGFAAPEKAEDYGLTKGLPEGADPAFAQYISSKALELGIPKSHLEGLAQAWNGYIGEAEKKHAEAEKLKGEAALGELKTQWGERFNESAELARRAGQEIMQTTGMSADQLNQIEGAIGTAAFLKMFAAVGSKNNAEAPFHGSEGGGRSGFMSPDAARAELNRLSGDLEFGKGFLAEQEKGVIGPYQEKFRQLNMIAAGAK